MFDNRYLRSLIIPLLIETLLSVTIGMMDTIMVATVGEHAVSGVSLVDSVSNLFVFLFSAFSTGGAVVASQYLGKKDEWALFRLQFEKVHPAFFQKLKQHCPDLTEGELRLCAYLSLGMESKQIAQMLSLQPDSIKKSRYRLRQKLRLETKDSIEDFLRRFL